jgi:hypothetical protein
VCAALLSLAELAQRTGTYTAEHGCVTLDPEDAEGRPAHFTISQQQQLEQLELELDEATADTDGDEDEAQDQGAESEGGEGQQEEEAADADGVQAEEVTADEDAPLQEEEAEETLDLAASAQEDERHTEEQPQVVVGRPFLVGTASVMSESESGGSDWVDAEQLQKGSAQQGV